MKPLHPNKEEQDGAVRRGPWTLDEDNLLIHYITSHGEGRWNLLAKSAGLKRTGKSCRLRWLNYLKPGIKRGNLTLQEQLLILELQTKWGNRWSKIAQHLPGRTDNEIKNYWRTRVQKHAKQLNMEPNSQSFFDAIKCYYIPRLVQKIEQNSFSSSITDHQESGASLFPPLQVENDYSDQSFNENSSSSVTPLSIYSSECSKILNPIEDSWNPSDPFNGYTSGKVPHFKAVDPALSSDVYYVGNSSYDMSAMGQRSNAYVADDSWISNEMADDTWIRDGLW